MNLGAPPVKRWQMVLWGGGGQNCCPFLGGSGVKSCPSSAALPLPSESFDAVVSDIPFGKKFKIPKDTPLLPDLLQEVERYAWPWTCSGCSVNATVVCNAWCSVSFRFALLQTALVRSCAGWERLSPSLVP